MIRLVTAFVALCLPLSFAYGTAQPYSIQGMNILTGKEIDIPARQAVVVFLSSRCPCSNSHIPEIVELSKAHTNFKFVGIHSNMDEAEADAKAYFEKVALPFPVVQDENARVADHFKALKTPHVFIVSAAGEVLYQGGVSDSKDCSKAGRKLLREALEDLKNNRPVKNSRERALGCTISRRRA